MLVFVRVLRDEFEQLFQGGTSVGVKTSFHGSEKLVLSF